MLNPIFWKKVQGQKHPGRWGIVEHQTPSIKVLFKTNAKSHKHPGIKLLSSESKTQLVNQRKQSSYRKCIYIYILTQSFWTGTKVIRRKHTIQDGRHFADDIFTCIFLNENVWNSIKISWKLAHKNQIDNIPALVQIMAWRWTGDKPLSEPMLVSLLTYIYITRPQRVKLSWD